METSYKDLEIKESEIKTIRDYWKIFTISPASVLVMQLLGLIVLKLFIPDWRTIDTFIYFTAFIAGMIVWNNHINSLKRSIGENLLATVDSLNAVINSQHETIAMLNDMLAEYAEIVNERKEK